MLAFLCSPYFWGEVAKMFGQFVGATLIAWLTVGWALRRYKNEKLWDRETTALVDVLSAIADLEAVNTRWIRDEARQVETDPTIDDELRQRYQSAKAKLEGIAATSTVLLPETFTRVIETLIASLNKRYDDWQEDLFETDAAVSKARKELVAVGRLRLRK